jgi:hypothetical protein
MKLVVNKNQFQHNLDKERQERIDNNIQEELNKLVEKLLGVLDDHQQAIEECTNDDIMNAISYLLGIWTAKAYTEEAMRTVVSPRTCLWSVLRMVDFQVSTVLSDTIGYNPLTDL